MYISILCYELMNFIILSHENKLKYFILLTKITDLFILHCFLLLDLNYNLNLSFSY